MRKVVVTGGGGFFGATLIPLLQQKGYAVVVLDLHNPNMEGVEFVQANLTEEIPKDEKLKNPMAVINLAGRNIFAKWNEGVKSQIYESRVVGTKNLAAFFEDEEFRPEVLVSASAVGYYGQKGEILVEEGAEFGKTFLARVAEDWEGAAKEAEKFGVRVVCIRNGLILGRGGLLGQLVPIYQKGLGGPLSDGSQWFSWVHIQDLANLYIAAIERKDFSGALNGVASEPVREAVFSKTLAQVLHRPHFLRVPKWALKIKFGEFADEILLSQRVISKRYKELDFHYEFGTLETALADIVGKEV